MSASHNSSRHRYHHDVRHQHAEQSDSGWCAILSVLSGCVVRFLQSYRTMAGRANRAASHLYDPCQLAGYKVTYRNSSSGFRRMCNPVTPQGTWEPSSWALQLGRSCAAERVMTIRLMYMADITPIRRYLRLPHLQSLYRGLWLWGAAYGPYGSAHWGTSYNPNTGTYARGATTSTAYGKQAVGEAYNPYTGAYGATHQGSNAYGSWGQSVVSKNGNTAYTQHASNA